MSMTAKEHRAAVCKALNAFLEDRFPKVDSIPARVRRRRVQAAEGEILTSEESLARLLEEEQARALAPKRPRGRPKVSAVQSGPIDNDPTDDDPSTDDEDPPNRDRPPIVNIKLIRVNSHIIWDNEGTYYPAIVVKKFRTWCRVTNMLPHSVSNLSLWTYGAAQKQCYYGEIKALIKPPALQGTSSGRGIDGNAVYLVEKIAKYWPKV